MPSFEVPPFEILEAFKNPDTGVFHAADSGHFMIVACVILIQYSSVTSTFHTHRPTPLP